MRLLTVSGCLLLLGCMYGLAFVPAFLMWLAGNEAAGMPALALFVGWIGLEAGCVWVGIRAYEEWAG